MHFSLISNCFKTLFDIKNKDTRTQWPKQWPKTNVLGHCLNKVFVKQIVWWKLSNKIYCRQKYFFTIESSYNWKLAIWNQYQQSILAVNKLNVKKT